MPSPATNIAGQPGSQSANAHGVPDSDEKSTRCPRDQSCDGGMRGVAITLASFFVHAMTSGFVKSLGVFLASWQEFFDEGASAVGWTISVTALFMLMTGKLDSFAVPLMLLYVVD